MDIVTYTLCKKLVQQGEGKAYVFKGSVASSASLPLSGNMIGDVWNTLDTGMNYAWTGVEWDALGGDIGNLYTKNEIDEKIEGLDERILALENMPDGEEMKF